MALFGRVFVVASRTFAAEAKPAAAAAGAASGTEDQVKKVIISKLKEYAAKKPKDYDAKQLAEALKKKGL